MYTKTYLLLLLLGRQSLHWRWGQGRGRWSIRRPCHDPILARRGTLTASKTSRWCSTWLAIHWLLLLLRKGSRTSHCGGPRRKLWRTMATSWPHAGTRQSRHGCSKFVCRLLKRIYHLDLRMWKRSVLLGLSLLRLLHRIIRGQASGKQKNRAQDSKKAIYFLPVWKNLLPADSMGW